MAHVDQVEAPAPRGSRRGKAKRAAVVQTEGERYTKLRSRDEHTFELMRDDRAGPRAYSAICFPGWKKA